MVYTESSTYYDSQAEPGMEEIHWIEKKKEKIYF